MISFSDNNYFNIPKRKVTYGLLIFLMCGLAIFVVSRLTYFAQSASVNMRNAIIMIAIFITLIFVYLRYNNYITKKITSLFGSENYETPINFLLSVGFLISIGIVYIIIINNTKNNDDNLSFFSKDADYTIINKYIISSVGLWFAMLLTILFFSKIKGPDGVKTDSWWEKFLIVIFIVCIIVGAFLNTSTEMNVYAVGDIVEVNDAGKSGWRWIRGKVKEAVFNNFTQMTAVYVDNLEYGDQGDNEEGNKNSRFSYGLASVRKPLNNYKLGDGVQVLTDDSWKSGTINGFTYHRNGEIKEVLVDRDDLTNDSHSYSINMPINVRSIPPGE